LARRGPSYPSCARTQHSVRDTDVGCGACALRRCAGASGGHCGIYRIVWENEALHGLLNFELLERLLHLHLELQPVVRNVDLVVILRVYLSFSAARRARRCRRARCLSTFVASSAFSFGAWPTCCVSTFIGSPGAPSAAAAAADAAAAAASVFLRSYDAFARCLPVSFCHAA